MCYCHYRVFYLNIMIFVLRIASGWLLSSCYLFIVQTLSNSLSRHLMLLQFLRRNRKYSMCEGKRFSWSSGPSVLVTPLLSNVRRGEVRRWHFPSLPRSQISDNFRPNWILAKFYIFHLAGSPAPQLNWWREHALIDGSYENNEPHKTVNTLLLNDLGREDLHSILTCQASNNNISNPVSTSVKIDMHCESDMHCDCESEKSDCSLTSDVLSEDKEHISPIPSSPPLTFDHHLSVIFLLLSFSRATQRVAAQQKGRHVGWQKIRGHVPSHRGETGARSHLVEGNSADPRQHHH